MQEKLLPKYQTTVTSAKVMNTRGGEAIANIALQENQCSNTLVSAADEASARK